jgi:iron complex transport system substrate-binding protein
MHHRLVALVVGSILVAAACTSTSGSAETTTSPPPEDGVFVGADGVATTVGDTSRIVSLTGDITEIIFELGLGESVVAVDITTTFPPEAEELKSSGNNVGFGQALAAESVLRYEPTLVLGDESIAPTETIEQLRDAGVPVIILEYQTTLPGVEEKISQVAAILGVPEAGEELARRVMLQVAAAQERAAQADSQPRVAYLYTRGPSVLLLFGQGIPTQAMIEGAGAIDVGAALGDGAIPLTPEALISAMPDVIVFPESGVEGLGGIEALLEIPGVAETPAGQNRAFLAYDEAYFFNLGPRAGIALDEFVDDLYPHLSD